MGIFQELHHLFSAAIVAMIRAPLDQHGSTSNSSASRVGMVSPMPTIWPHEKFDEKPIPRNPE